MRSWQWENCLTSYFCRSTGWEAVFATHLTQNSTDPPSCLFYLITSLLPSISTPATELEGEEQSDPLSSQLILCLQVAMWAPSPSKLSRMSFIWSSKTQYFLSLKSTYLLLSVSFRYLQSSLAYRDDGAYTGAHVWLRQSQLVSAVQAA